MIRMHPLAAAIAAAFAYERMARRGPIPLAMTPGWRLYVDGR